MVKTKKLSGSNLVGLAFARAVASKLVADPVRAEELAEACWLAFVERALGARTPVNPVAWLATLVRRKAVRLSRRPRRLGDAVYDLPHVEAEHPPKEASWREKLTAILPRLDTVLDTRERNVLRASLLGTPTKTVARIFGLDRAQIRRSLRKIARKARKIAENASPPPLDR